MTEKWHRLCCRHRWVPVVITAAIGLTQLLLMAGIDGPIGLIAILCGVMLLISLSLGSSSGTWLINRAILVRQNTCDPLPLLQETAWQLSVVKNRSDRSMLTINRSAALIDLGQYELALTELESLNIDDPAVLPILRLAYYNNLTIAALECGQPEKATVYYQKTAQQLPSVKGRRQHAQCVFTQLTAILRLAQGDPESALALLTSLPSVDRYTAVEQAYLYAHIARARGDAENTRQQLEYVIQAGNRMYRVEQARHMLNAL